MWRHKRPKKPNAPDAQPSQQESRHHRSRLRDIFGLSRSLKHDASVSQAARRDQNVIERNPDQFKEKPTIAIETRDQSSKAAQSKCIDEVDPDYLVAEASIRAETESSAPPVSEPPTIGTDGHGTTGQDSIKKEPRDLWREAVEKLDEKQRTTLGLLDMAESPPPSAVNAIEDVVQKTEKNLEAYNTSGQMKRRDGKVLINVRENAKKILRGTLRVKDIIDAGVKFDPSGYASTAWGIISLGLQLAQNDVQRIDDVFSASAFLTHILARYANIEANYRDETVRDVEHLENHLVAVYKAILEYSAKVQENHTLGLGSRVLETFYALDKPPLQELRRTVEDADFAMNKWRELIEHEYRIKEAAQIEKRVNGVLDKLQDTSAQLRVLMTAEEQREFTEITNWLPTMSTASKHDSKIKDRHPDTAEWIFDNEEYLSWLDGGDVLNHVLWVHGPYGSGKSVLLVQMWPNASFTSRAVTDHESVHIGTSTVAPQPTTQTRRSDP